MSAPAGARQRVRNHDGIKTTFLKPAIAGFRVVKNHHTPANAGILF